MLAAWQAPHCLMCWQVAWQKLCGRCGSRLPGTRGHTCRTAVVHRNILSTGADLVLLRFCRC